jgi:hypothetical protein
MAGIQTADSKRKTDRYFDDLTELYADVLAARPSREEIHEWVRAGASTKDHNNIGAYFSSLKIVADAVVNRMGDRPSSMGTSNMSDMELEMRLREVIAHIEAEDAAREAARKVIDISSVANARSAS